MTQCINCGKLTQNPKFCSRRCAAIYTNKLAPKRKPAHYFCQVCGIETGHRRKFCDLHQPNSLRSYDHVMLGEIRQQAKYQANALIRRLARRAYTESNLPYRCYICGYSTHVEICHIRAIQSFPDSALISWVNSPSNLVALCPNHHWEFDHGQLSL